MQQSTRAWDHSIFVMLTIALAVLPSAETSAQEPCYITDIDAFVEQCPTFDPAIDQILDDFRITKDGVDVTSFYCVEPISALPIGLYTDELILLQGLRTIYYMDRDRCHHLPWTDLTLYDWLKSKIGGFNIDSGATYNSCCGIWPDGSRYVTLTVNDEYQRDFDRDWRGIGGNIGLLFHEARHMDGFPHVACCPNGTNCDQRYDEANLSPHAMQYWLARSWLDGSLHTGYTCYPATRISQIKSWFRSVANRQERFCEDPPELLTDANPPEPPCDSSCAVEPPTCIARATGVPPNMDPPVWWDSSPPQPLYHDQLDDPRWSGASKITYGDGTGDKADLRVLHDNTNLYLSWRVFTAPASSPDQNVLYFGYQQPSGDEVIVRLWLTSLAPAPAADSGFAMEAFVRNPDGTQGASVPLLSALTTTARVWVHEPEPGTWAVQLVLPLSALDVDCHIFRLWYELLAGTPTLPVSQFSWPRDGAHVMVDDSVDPPITTYPAATSWQRFRLSTGTTDPHCKTAGVSLDRHQIGTTNSPSSLFEYSTTPPHPSNTLFARPTNRSGVDIPPGGLTARFRIANWGSVPGDWEAGVPLDQLWATIPGGEAVANSATINNGTTAGPGNDIRFDWQITEPDLSRFSSGERRPHQCMLVELSSPMADGLTFVNSSIYRNMDFVTASTFSRPAELSVVGLASLSSDPRDLYLWVETHNMPASVKERPREQRPSTSAAMLRAAGTINQAQLDRELPSYRVHVYHDTGRRVETGGTIRPVLAHQTAFGYWVTHDGELDGWRHHLEGPGLEELAPGWYRIPAPNNGTTTVTTTIEAVEPSRWSLSLHAGSNDVQGLAGGYLDPGLSLGLDLEYRCSDRFAIELFLGSDGFDGPSRGGNLDIVHLSLSGKAYLLSGTLRPFILVGAGSFDFNPGPSRFGLNAGAGLRFDRWTRLALELTLRHTTVDTSGPDFEFVAVHAGVRIGF